MTLLEIFTYVSREMLRDRPVSKEILSDVRSQHRTDTIFRLLDEAQDRVARDTYCIEDEDTADISSYALTNGVADLTLASSVFSLQDDAWPRIVDADGEWHLLDRVAKRFGTQWDNGIPQYYKVRKQNKTLTITLYPTPGEDNLTFNCPVYRLPIVRFADQPGESPSQKIARRNLECELDDHYQQGLGYYVLYQLLIHRKLDRAGERERDELWARWNEVIYSQNADVHRQTNAHNPIAAAPWY